MRVKLTHTEGPHQISLPLEFAVLPSTAHLVFDGEVMNDCNEQVGTLYEQINALKECGVELQVNKLEEMKALQEACEGMFR